MLSNLTDEVKLLARLVIINKEGIAGFSLVHSVLVLNLMRLEENTDCLSTFLKVEILCRKCLAVIKQVIWEVDRIQLVCCSWRSESSISSDCLTNELIRFFKMLMFNCDVLTLAYLSLFMYFQS
jgi:hypothetical protein